MPRYSALERDVAIKAQETYEDLAWKLHYAYHERNTVVKIANHMAELQWKVAATLDVLRPDKDTGAQRSDRNGVINEMSRILEKMYSAQRDCRKLEAEVTEAREILCSKLFNCGIMQYEDVYGNTHPTEISFAYQRGTDLPRHAPAPPDPTIPAWVPSDEYFRRTPSPPRAGRFSPPPSHGTQPPPSPPPQTRGRPDFNRAPQYTRETRRQYRERQVPGSGGGTPLPRRQRSRSRSYSPRPYRRAGPNFSTRAEPSPSKSPRGRQRRPSDARPKASYSPPPRAYARQQRPNPRSPPFQPRTDRFGTGARDAYGSAPNHPYSRPEAKPQPSNATLIMGWLGAIERLSANTSLLRRFPEPPTLSSATCTNPECKTTEKERTLAACKCNLRAIFESSLFDPKELKAFRQKCHPDKFWKCPESKRKAVQAGAKEVFIVVNEVYEQKMKDGK